MRFERLELHRFGHFERLSIGFGNAPLHVVYGRNEAGKTTLLTALRDVLFGIPLRSPYGYRFGNRAIELRAELSMADAQRGRLDLRRRKGRKEPLAGSLRTGDDVVRKIDEAALARLMAPMDRGLFESVFGFTLNDLESGAQLLRHAGVAELLAGGALGGAGERVLRVVGELDDRLAASWRANAKKGTVPEILRAAEAARKIARDAALGHDRLRALQASIAETRARADALETELAALDARAKRNSLLHASVGIHEKLTAVRAQLDAESLSTPIEAPERAAEIVALLDGLASLRARHEALAEDVAEAERLAAAEAPDEQLLAVAERVSDLARRLPEVRLVARQVEDEAIAIAGRRDAIVHGLSATLPSADAIGFARRPLAPDVVAGLESAFLRLDELDALVADAEEERTRAESELARERERESRLGATDDVASLDALESDRERAQRAEAQLEALDARIASLVDGIEVRRERMVPELAADVDPRTLKLPPPAEIAAAGQRLAALETRAADARARIADAKTRIAHCDADRAALDAADVPVPRLLDDARARRDAAWALVLRAWRDGEDVAKESAELDPERPLADAHAAAQNDADRIADRLRDGAETVARRIQVDREAARARADLEAAQGDAEAVASERALWEEGWRARFADAGIVAGSPETMGAWVGEVESLRSEQKERADAVRERAAQAETVRTWRLRAAQVLDVTDASMDALADALRRRRDGAHARAASLSEIADRRTRLERDRDEACDRVAVAQTEHEATVAGARAAWSSLGLREDLTPVAARGMLRSLQQLHAEATELDSAEGQHAVRARMVAGFRAEISALVSELSRTTDGLTLEQFVERLQSELAESLTRRKVRDQARSLADKKRDERRAVGERMERQEEEVAASCEQLAAADEIDLRTFADRAVRRAALLDDLRGFEASLERNLARSTDADAIRAELATVDPDALESEYADIERTKEARANELRHVDAELGGLERQEKELGKDLALRARAEYEEHRSALAEAAGQHVELWLARAVLGRVMDRFVREHRPAILERASTLLFRMTEGKHVEVTQPLGSDTLAVVGSDGAERTPDKLSTATHQQLFLALRLAYVLEYSDQSEPLPVVMDDVLVNVDDERQSATFAAIADVGRQVQVVYLTCHEGTVERARHAVPDLVVHPLDPEGRAAEAG